MSITYEASSIFCCEEEGKFMNIGILIAIATICTYIIVGPLVLFAIYVFIDRLAQGYRSGSQNAPSSKDDPALWGKQEVKMYVKHGFLPRPRPPQK